MKSIVVRRLRNAAPIQSVKHEITWSNLVQNAAATQTIVLAKGTPSADVNDGTEVEIGHKVTRIYFEFHFSADTVVNPKVIHWVIDCTLSGMTAGNPNTYNQDDRSFIFQRGMEMLPQDQSTVFKRILSVKVPKIYQRAKANWFLRLRYICSSAEAINACGIAIYKDIS